MHEVFVWFRICLATTLPNNWVVSLLHRNRILLRGRDIATIFPCYSGQNARDHQIYRYKTTCVVPRCFLSFCWYSNYVAAWFTPNFNGFPARNISILDTATQPNPTIMGCKWWPHHYAILWYSRTYSTITVFLRYGWASKPQIYAWLGQLHTRKPMYFYDVPPQTSIRFLK